MITNKLDHCPFCGEKSYQHQIQPLTLQYKSHFITVNQPGYWCNKCQEGVIGGEDRKATQKELQTFRSNIDGLLSPDEVKFIREKLHLTQQKAGDFFGGGINAFSRYERGETSIPRSLSQLLRLLDKNPELLKQLKNFSPEDSTHTATQRKKSAAG